MHWLTRALKGGKKPEGKSDERLSTDVQEALSEGLALKRYLLKLHEKKSHVRIVCN